MWLLGRVGLFVIRGAVCSAADKKAADGPVGVSPGQTPRAGRVT